MGESESEEEGCDGQSGDEGQSEECLEVLVVETSGTSVSTKTILRLPERNDDVTTWTRADVNRPVDRRHYKSTQTEGSVVERSGQK